MAFPDEGEGGDEQVQHAVVVGLVERETLYDGLREDEPPWTCEVRNQQLGNGYTIDLGLRAEVLVAGLAAQTTCFECEEARVVGFLEEGEAEDLDEDVGDGCAPEDPAPCCVFGDEAARDGADCGS